MTLKDIYLSDDNLKWLIAAVVIPIIAALIGIFRRKKKIRQTQSQRITGSGEQKQSQSLED